MAQNLTDNWQIDTILTDNWHLSPPIQTLVYRIALKAESNCLLLDFLLEALRVVASDRPTEALASVFSFASFYRRTQPWTDCLSHKFFMDTASVISFFLLQPWLVEQNGKARKGTTARKQTKAARGKKLVKASDEPIKRENGYGESEIACVSLYPLIIIVIFWCW